MLYIVQIKGKAVPFTPHNSHYTLFCSWCLVQIAQCSIWCSVPSVKYDTKAVSSVAHISFCTHCPGVIVVPCRPVRPQMPPQGPQIIFPSQMEGAMRPSAIIFFLLHSLHESWPWRTAIYIQRCQETIVPYYYY